MTDEGRGVVSLDAARAAVGDEAFEAAIGDLSSTAAQRTLTIDDVVEALEARSGIRLNGLRRGLGLVTVDDED